jgi:hypothetical protein
MVYESVHKGNGAQEKTRTSTTLRSLTPEASASTNSATWAGIRTAHDQRARSRYCALQVLSTAMVDAPMRAL